MLPKNANYYIKTLPKPGLRRLEEDVVFRLKFESINLITLQGIESNDIRMFESNPFTVQLFH